MAAVIKKEHVHSFQMDLFDELPKTIRDVINYHSTGYVFNDIVKIYRLYQSTKDENYVLWAMKVH